MSKDAWLYFHSPCFDGIIFCVIAWDFLEESQRWQIERFCPVDYSTQASWLSSPLHAPSAIVDFLYHPEAAFWADHHQTPFPTKAVEEHFEQHKGDRFVLYDDRFGSCAKLLWQKLADRFGYQNPRYAEMVEWANKIDSARYASVDEAILGDAPALRIRASMSLDQDSTYFERLVKALRAGTLEEVAKFPEVSEAASRVQAKIKAGLERFGRVARLADGEVVIFDIDTNDDMISRYAPYHFFPRARYSVGILRSKEGAKIAAMRNPWIEFPSVPLGKIFEKFGGGGHQRVGALRLLGDRRAEARPILERLLDEIRAEDAVLEARKGTA